MPKPTLYWMIKRKRFFSCIGANQVAIQPLGRLPRCPVEESGSDPKLFLTPLEKPIICPIPFPQRLKKYNIDKQYNQFAQMFKQLTVNIPFADALVQMPNYAKSLKEILTGKIKLDDHETIMLAECSPVLFNKLPHKERSKEFLDNLPFKWFCEYKSFMWFRSKLIWCLSIYRKLRPENLQRTNVSIQLADNW